MLKSEKDLLHFHNAVSHIEHRPASDTRRGRPARWSRADLLKMARWLCDILEHETQWRVSLSIIKGQYLPVLHFPADAISTLESSDIRNREKMYSEPVSHNLPRRNTEIH